MKIVYRKNKILVILTPVVIGVCLLSIQISYGYFWSELERLEIRPGVSPLRLDQGLQNMPVVENDSYLTDCGEEDNLRYYFTGEVGLIKIIAEHPSYILGHTDDSVANFENCPACLSQPGSVATNKVYDDGRDVVLVRQDSNWWRDSMEIEIVGGGTYSGDQLVLHRKREGDNYNSWPEVLVLGSDGSLRLKPHPREGEEDNKFGTTVILGPIQTEIDSITGHERPYADIARVVVDPQESSLIIYYSEGGSCLIKFFVDRDQAVIEAAIDYDTTKVPFAAVTSMCVNDRRNDADSISTGTGGEEKTIGVFDEIPPSDRFELFRTGRPKISTQNPSAPDIELIFSN
jgi:hypothetical protein